MHDLRVQLTDPDAIDRSVRTICSTLFGGGRSIDLDSVRDRDVASASREHWQLLRDSGLRHTTWLGTTLFWVGYLGLIGFGWWQLALGLSGLVWPFLGLGTLAVLLLVAEAHYPTLGRLTADGRTLRDQLAGLHRFVTMAEADRIAWMQNAVDAPRVGGGPDDTSLVDLYEPLLPYAIIFGVENTWRQALGTLYDLAPAKAERPARLPALEPGHRLGGRQRLPRLLPAPHQHRELLGRPPGLGRRLGRAHRQRARPRTRLMGQFPRRRQRRLVGLGRRIVAVVEFVVALVRLVGQGPFGRRHGRRWWRRLVSREQTCHMPMSPRTPLTRAQRVQSRSATW